MVAVDHRFALSRLALLSAPEKIVGERQLADLDMCSKWSCVAAVGRAEQACEADWPAELVATIRPRLSRPRARPVPRNRQRSARHPRRGTARHPLGWGKRTLTSQEWSPDTSAENKFD